MTIVYIIQEQRVCESRINTEMLESDRKTDLGSFYGQMFGVVLDRLYAGRRVEHGEATVSMETL